MQFKFSQHKEIEVEVRVDMIAVPKTNNPGLTLQDNVEPDKDVRYDQTTMVELEKCYRSIK